MLLSLLCSSAHGLVIPLPAAKPAVALDGTSLTRISDGTSLDIGKELAATTEKTLCIFGTHAGDFNAIEYAQKATHYWPALQAKGVSRCLMIVNGQASSCTTLVDLLDLPDTVEVLADPTGDAGRAFGVSRGFRPDDASLSPFLKLFVVGIGLGPPWGTLLPVLSGYVGAPNGKRAWIESALKQGQLKDRWPDSLLEIGAGGAITANKFDNTPLVSGWGRRPFELATLRLQNLASLQFKNWEALKPVDDRCLTQLGGCCVVGPSGEALYSWLDQGLCDVSDFDEMLETL